MLPIYRKCNFQKKETCPMPGKCCTEAVVYKATVSHPDGSNAIYIGSTEPSFKLRFNNHKKSFKHHSYKAETTLSKYLWDNNINQTANIKWEIIKQCKTYNVGSKTCDLCLTEKLHIIKNLHNPRLINKRTDIGNRCTHKSKHTFCTPYP